MDWGVHHCVLGATSGYADRPDSVPFGPINNIKQTFEHPQAIARGVTVEIDVRPHFCRLQQRSGFDYVFVLQHPRAGPVKLVAPAVMYNGKRMPVTRPPPYLSQHTDEVLQELGYDTTQIEELRTKGIV